MAFKVNFVVECGGRTFSGLEALDMRRRLKLPEGTELTIEKADSSGYLEVDEAFARRRFHYDSSRLDLLIPTAQLVPGDLEMRSGSEDCARLVEAKLLAHHLECPECPEQ
jgi:hypothetical protein